MSSILILIFQCFDLNLAWFHTVYIPMHVLLSFDNSVLFRFLVCDTAL